MMGLILKDLYTLSRYSRFMLLYFLVFGVIFAGDGSSSFVAMVVVVVGMLSISTFSYDDQAKWDQYALSTPVGRKKIVLAKYLLALLLVAAGVVLGLAMALAGSLFRGQGVPMETLLATGISSLVGALFTSVIIPFIYKFGTEKSRLIMMLVYALPTLGVMGVAKMLPREQLDAFGGWLEASATALLWALPLFCIAAICFSYVVSVHIYLKKEV